MKTLAPALIFVLLLFVAAYLGLSGHRELEPHPMELFYGGIAEKARDDLFRAEIVQSAVENAGFETNNAPIYELRERQIEAERQLDRYQAERQQRANLFFGGCGIAALGALGCLLALLRQQRGNTSATVNAQRFDDCRGIAHAQDLRPSRADLLVPAEPEPLREPGKTIAEHVQVLWSRWRDSRATRGAMMQELEDQIAARLRELHRLRTSGQISDAEFRQKLSEILSGL